MKIAELTGFKAYCASLTAYQRLKTREVAIGNTPVGGLNPIRIQSMTTTDTMDTQATVDQTLRMVEAGCEYVRITAPSLNEANNLANIKAELRKRGCNVPLVADIHFTPNAAEAAARIVEKVRINPGNYADKKKFEQIDYTDAEYANELERIYKRFSPLVKVCKAYGTAMRIGVNHGSLSDRIMSRYGDTPEGMVESAMEFVRICEDLGYRQLVISMKASSPLVMVQAYRLLAATMIARGEVYPLHVGVTEAGEGEDGRIKSALGCGALLADGLGDTIRVSLTEPPENEMPVARYIVNAYTKPAAPINPVINTCSLLSLPFDPFDFVRRANQSVANLGTVEVPRVIADFSHHSGFNETDLISIGHVYDPTLDKWHMTDLGADYIYTGSTPINFMPPNGLKTIYDASLWSEFAEEPLHIFPYFNALQAYENALKTSSYLNFVKLSLNDVVNTVPDVILGARTVVWVLEASDTQTLRFMISRLVGAGFSAPIVIRAVITPRTDEPAESVEACIQLSAACAVAEPFIDGWADGLWLVQPQNPMPVVLNRAAFGILQGVRQRITRTEYISCPSCGRTLFDLQQTTAKIRQRTEHLKGVKIGIMGCIVNGPGEMADADYGYVGSGVNVISLYKGKEMVVKAVPTEQAVDKLIDLIRQDGRWIDPA